MIDENILSTQKINKWLSEYKKTKDEKTKRN